ncbi:DUF6662 family protein [Thiomicrorhabdus heinhorstiae]|uniref:Uncharacterized protein n=1 Tax=Thiomicrorhabdus heinhorstiae TaxID=2748010 RepID=A0ABS0BXI0_9GAMM|nr:DUF6662 family protein [Thiomicrorhabdus heinhorstiae]MBF6056777.1 hypothetical protein [Thiomicrorhabdus heinhorstiae]
MMKNKLTAGLVSAALCATLGFASTAVQADENLLGYTAGAETLPQGAKEAYLWITHHGDKRRGDYQAQSVRAEYEYGLTNRTSIAAYLNAYRLDYDCGVGCAGPLSDPEISGSQQSFDLSGVSAEIKHMLLSPYADGLGVALYGELTYDTVDSLTGEKGQGWELETKLILQKPYLDGQLQWLTNLELEVESWKADGQKSTEMAIAPRLRSGVSYRFAPKWYIGAEGWVDQEMLDPTDGTWTFDHWDAFAGPSIHYGSKDWWFTLTYAQQIVGTDESDDNRNGLHLADHESYETRLKIGYNF